MRLFSIRNLFPYGGKICVTVISLLFFQLAAFSQDYIISSGNIPISSSAGSSINVSVTILNIGNKYGDYSYTGFYLSNDSIYNSAEDTYLSEYFTYGIYPNNYGYVSTDLLIPQSVGLGKKYIIALADYGSNISEDKENNNSKPFAITLLAPSVDLTIQDISTTTQTVSPGSYLQVNYNLANLGSTSSSYSSTGYYISSDTILNTTFDKFLNSDYSYGVSGGGSMYQYASMSIPNNVSEGVYYILIVADYKNEIKETNEKNNVAKLKITVSSPDLIIKNPTLSETDISAGSTISSYCFVSNIGLAPAYGNTTGYYLSQDTSYNNIDDVSLGYSYLYTIDKGASIIQNASLAIPSQVDEGDYYIIFVADEEKVVTEKNENNNIKYLKVHVSPPDLDFSIGTIAAPKSISAGSDFYSSFYFNNNGKSNSPQTTVNIYLAKKTTRDSKDIFLGTSQIYESLGNSSNYFSNDIIIPSSTAEGNYYLLFVADEDNLINETDETNNTAYKNLTVGKPDLLINSLSLSTDKAELGNTVSIYYFLSNKGTASTSNVNMGYYLSKDTIVNDDDKFLGSYYDYYYGTINPNESSFKSSDLIIKGVDEGTYYLIVMADYTNTIPEINEKNNVSYSKIKITAPDVDLLITNPTSSLTRITSGGYIELSNNLKNIGHSDAASNSTGYYVSTDTIFDPYYDSQLGTYYSDFTKVGTTFQKPYSFYFPYLNAGNYYILFVADYGDNIVEKNEKNNVAYLPIIVDGPYVDLTITNAYASLSTANAGDNIIVTNYVMNNGTAYSYYNRTGYYLSSDTIFDMYTDSYLSEQYIYGIYGGESSYQYANFNLPTSASTGKKYILIVADYFNDILENNENNNISYVPITIQGGTVSSKSDLKMGKTTISSSIISNGASLTASETIANIGDRTVSTYELGIFLSKDSILDNSDVNLTLLYMDSLVVGKKYVNSTQITIPYNTKKGSYYILHVADPYNKVEENSEYNNLASNQIYVDGLSAIEEATSFEFSLYPNPAKKEVFIKSINQIIISGSWTITNLLGMEYPLTATTENTELLKLNLESLNLPQGIYILKSKTSDKVLEKKISIE